ncbi:MAG TPA: hypothetical protein VGC15_11445, partial [Acetobacteraceae bacterium]
MRIIINRRPDMSSPDPLPQVLLPLRSMMSGAVGAAALANFGALDGAYAQTAAPETPAAAAAAIEL